MNSRNMLEASRDDGPNPPPVVRRPGKAGRSSAAKERPSSPVHIAVLTGGRDRPYALGIANMLWAQGIRCDFIGSNALDAPELHANSLVRFLNLRGDQSADAGLFQKIVRVLVYYARLLAYAVAARPKIFHILWHNKFDAFDRTIMMGIYKLLGKRLVFTAHNVNAGKRDGRDTWLNRVTLHCQYRLADHILVHTERMRNELMHEFGVSASKVTVIPFGINNTVPTSNVTQAQARERLGIEAAEKTILFFGNIAPYKGVEYLAAALSILVGRSQDYRLIIAGKPKGCDEYWEGIWNELAKAGVRDRVLARIEYIPDEEIEIYFKAADVLVLPYTQIFQSGVLFLSYSFGLPVVAADVGSLKEEIVSGRTGLVFRACDPVDLARCIEAYFAGELYRELDFRRGEIREFANERYSWGKVGEITEDVYKQLLGDG